MNRTAIVLGLMAALLLPSTAMATQGSDHKVPLCHRTASDSNPYVYIVVDKASLPAHLNNLPGHPQKHGRDDFRPSQWQINNKTCDDRPIQPRDRLDPRFNYRVCGDPRLLITINNRRSTVPVTYTFTFRNPRYGQRTRSFTVPAGTRDVLHPIWVKGRSYVRWTMSAPGFYTPAVVRSFRLQRTTPWGEGKCPANLRAAKRLARNN